MGHLSITLEVPSGYISKDGRLPVSFAATGLKRPCDLQVLHTEFRKERDYAPNKTNDREVSSMTILFKLKISSEKTEKTGEKVLILNTGT